MSTTTRTAPGPGARLAGALAAATTDRLVLDLTGIEHGLAALRRELPGVHVRFALKACPADEVVTTLARAGAGADAAGPAEIEQALRCGVPADRVHYGNTVKSDRHIAAAHRLGVRLFATDSREDVAALAAHAPGARVFCRVATGGEGALWGLSHKFGCPPAQAAGVLELARDLGLVPSGLSVHVGSQQMTAGAWRTAVADLGEVLRALRHRGITLDHVNLGGGLPARGYLDRHGRRLDPPLDKIFAVLREGMDALRRAHGGALEFVVEPGRYLVADHGAVRAHVARLARRSGPDGTDRYWLYLSCGKFNGLYEMDALQYRLVFPGHPGGDTVPAVVAGPTCDSDDAYSHEAGSLVRVPRALASGDPVWVLSAGAYALSYTTRGFNGFPPLPCHTVTGGTDD
ncbi:type III PLP-dependent enzyme [Streptomyces griseoviridis]|uniref:ornithine decarboxylase n=1 Tax=Streptomyces griseoviridis TaxID=45398 RepID=A0ABT9LR95_STRGD|nr:type III PLP-dependent enzyme [Streptomyces griseoviridis]MDP9686061.1 ornithine decarboxylase [Streptomyces griseoviridis]GGS79110.1 lysine/ornithine decarboxylase [Streptomyces griseoviridis]